MNPFSLIKTFKCYFHSFLMNTIPCSKIVLSQHEQINEFGMFTYSQTRSAKVSIYCTPQDSISIGSCRFQIQLRILVWIISREVTREAVDVCNLRNFHSKIFNLTKYREVLVKYSLPITHTGVLSWIWH